VTLQSQQKCRLARLLLMFAAPIAAQVKGLPSGWDAKKDKNGRIYFINHVAKTTQWQDPRPLPPGWAMRFDERQKRAYFVNHNAKTTQWVDPRPPLVFPEENKEKREKIVDTKDLTTEQKDLEWYKDVLKMCLADKQITPDEERLLVSIKTKLHISEPTHEKLLQDVGWTMEEFKSHRVDEGSVPAYRECIVCLDASADHVLLDCMHICLCESCADLMQKGGLAGQTCPKCRAPIKSIRKTFY